MRVDASPAPELFGDRLFDRIGQRVRFAQWSSGICLRVKRYMKFVPTVLAEGVDVNVVHLVNPIYTTCRGLDPLDQSAGFGCWFDVNDDVASGCDSLYLLFDL